MLRIVVSSVLALEALLGPGMCCCLALRAASSVAAPAAQQADTASPKRSCCQAKAQPKKQSQPTRTGPASRCPCRGDDAAGDKTPAPSILEKSTASLKFATDIFAGAPLAVAPPLPVVQEPETTATARSAPFLSADELLNLLHILRC